MLDQGRDQAAGLRSLMGPRAVHLLPLAVVPLQSAHWIAQLTHGLRELGRQPVVLDAAGGHAALAFGLRPKGDLLDLLEGREPFDMVAHSTRDGIHVLRGDLGIEAFVGSGGSTGKLLTAFGGLSHGFDELLLAMRGTEIASVATPDEHVPIVAVDAGQSGVVRSYSLVKQLAGDFGYRRFACIGIGAGGEQPARDAFDRVAAAARQFLCADMGWAGWLGAGGDSPGLHAAARTAHALLRMTRPTPICQPA